MVRGETTIKRISGGKSGGENSRKKGQKHTVTAYRLLGDQPVAGARWSEEELKLHRGSEPTTKGRGN